MRWMALLKTVAAATLSLAVSSGCAPSSHDPLARYADLRPPAAGSSPPRLTATYFGTSTILLDDGRDRIMIDAFFSRPGLGRLAVGPVLPDRERILQALRRARVGRLSAIFAAHAHYDHVMDAPDVAIRTGAHFVGSPSAANAARREAFDETRLHEVEDGARCRFGDFTVTLYATPHGPTPLPVGGEIAKPLPRRPGVYDYKDGDNFSFLVHHPLARILIVPSGALERDLPSESADVVFLGVAQLTRKGEENARLYWDRAVRVPGARLVVPIHWDNLLRPLSKPLAPFPPPIDRFDRTMDWLGKLSEQSERKVRLMLAQAFDSIELSNHADPPSGPDWKAAPRPTSRKPCEAGI